MIIESISFSQFWITSDIDPNYGEIEICINDQKQSIVSLYNEKHETNIVIYESPRYNTISNYKITIKNHDNRKVIITQIQYNPYLGKDIKYDDLDGLINVTCENFKCISSCGLCQSGEYASGGTYVNKDGSLEYKFNGTKVHVVSYDQDNNNVGGIMQILIDGKAVGEVQPTSRTSDYLVVYSSDYYPYGEHTILIKHIGTVDGKSFYINSFLVDPLPEVGGHKLGFSDIKENKGWILNTSLRTPFFKCTTSDGSFEFKFHGTRFWLTGIRDDSYGKCKLIIDGKEMSIIDGRTGIEEFVVKSGAVQVRVRANGNQGVLLYESNILEFKDHTIKIEKSDDKEFRIINLLYTTQPYNAIVVPSNEITFDEHWTSEADGYSTSHNGASCMITEYMNHIWIIGNKIPNNQALMNIYYNSDKEENIDIMNIESYFNNEILFKTLQSITRDTYLTKVEKTGNPTENTKVLHISYFYYLNEKTINVPDESHKIDVNEMENKKEGSWELIDDNIVTEEEGASISVDFYGKKFWLYGTLHPNYGTIDIIFDGQKQSSVSLYNEKSISNVIIYESPDDFSQDEHSLKLVNKKNTRISIYQIVYQVLPSTEMFSLSNDFTISSHFSNTDSFTQTDKFSKSDHFSDTNDFTKTEHFSSTFYFSESIAFTPSATLGYGDFCLFESQEVKYTSKCNFTIEKQKDVIIHVILSNFTNYIEEGSGGAVYIKNAGLNCSFISFINCVSTNGGGGAIYIKNNLDLMHNITIKDVSIKECQAQYGGGCYIYSQSDENDVSIIRSIFSDNFAKRQKETSETKIFFGGNHIFMTCLSSNVKNSTFEKRNKKYTGSAVKICNVFDQISKGASKLDETPNNIFISGCNFKQMDSSSCSINYIDYKSDSKIELIDCDFAGKLTQNSHYIEGKVVSKDANNIMINSCRFEYKNEMAVKIDLLDDDKLMKTEELLKNKSYSSVLSSCRLSMILFCVGFIIITLISVVIKLSKRKIKIDVVDR